MLDIITASFKTKGYGENMMIQGLEFSLPQTLKTIVMAGRSWLTNGDQGQVLMLMFWSMRRL